MFTGKLVWLKTGKKKITFMFVIQFFNFIFCVVGIDASRNRIGFRIGRRRKKKEKVDICLLEFE